jgi:hypothetical protein
MLFRRAKSSTESASRVIIESISVLSCLVFSGVLHSKVDAIRKIAVLACDAIYDPQPDDTAHANIVVFDKGPEEILTVTNTLLENLIWVTHTQIAGDPILAPKQ